jgi:hypothetical protein
MAQRDNNSFFSTTGSFQVSQSIRPPFGFRPLLALAVQLRQSGQTFRCSRGYFFTENQFHDSCYPPFAPASSA